MPEASKNHPPAKLPTLIASIERQFADIAKRVGNDLKLARDEQSTAHSSFISYPLFDHENKNLSEDLLTEMKLKIVDLEKLAHYRSVHKIMENNFCRMIFDPYLDFSATPPRRCLRLTIDGW